MWKYIWVTLLFGCLALPACAGNYLPMGEPIKTEIVNSQVYITWIRFEDHEQVKEECERMGVTAKKGHRVVACASFDIEKQTCTIYALNPQTLNDQRTTLLGHEVKHCFDGSYHD